MSSKKAIQVKDISIHVNIGKNDDDYICLTDMARFKNPDEPDVVVSNWLRLRYTIEFLGCWEDMYNPNFNPIDFEGFKNQAGNNSFTLSPKKWILTTNALGIRSKAGRYGGGTFAHKDIALEFASWLSPEFKLYLIKEFQRLKELEKTTVQSLEWQIKRSLSKTNYLIHTGAIAKKLKESNFTKWQENLVYATEADMLNMILWRKTAKEWEGENLEDVKNHLNIRDTADITDLIILSNLETLNARFIDEGKPKVDRAQILSEIAEQQRLTLAKNLSVEHLKKLSI